MLTLYHNGNKIALVISDKVYDRFSHTFHKNCPVPLRFPDILPRTRTVSACCKQKNPRQIVDYLYSLTIPPQTVLVIIHKDAQNHFLFSFRYAIIKAVEAFLLPPLYQKGARLLSGGRMEQKYGCVPINRKGAAQIAERPDRRAPRLSPHRGCRLRHQVCAERH